MWSESDSVKGLPKIASANVDGKALQVLIYRFADLRSYTRHFLESAARDEEAALPPFALHCAALAMTAAVETNYVKNEEIWSYAAPIKGILAWL